MGYTLTDGLVFGLVLAALVVVVVLITYIVSPPSIQEMENMDVSLSR